MQKAKYITNKFIKLKNLIQEPTMYGTVDGQLILGAIASYVFTNEAKTEWDYFLLELLKKNELTEYVSLKTIDKSLRPHLENFLIDQSIEIEEFNKNLSALKKYKSHRNFHYFVVSGLKSIGVNKFSNIKIGLFEDKCNFEKNSFSEKINKTYNEILEYNYSQGLITSTDIFKHDIYNEIDAFKGQNVLEVENFGDQYISKEKSLKDAEHFINELIFLRSLCSSLKFQIGLNREIIENDIRPLHLNYENLCFTLPSKEFTFTSFLDFTFKNDPQFNIAIPFKDLTFPLISSYFEKNDLLENLRLAVDWYASSYKTNINKEGFLFCAIGLEVLFSKDNKAISQNLSESTAFLIAKKDFDSRRTIFKRMKTLYGKRNGIAHGESSIIEESDLRLIRSYLSYSIIAIIRKIQKGEIHTLQDLSDYFEEQKFG